MALILRVMAETELQSFKNLNIVFFWPEKNAGKNILPGGPTQN